MKSLVAYAIVKKKNPELDALEIYASINDVDKAILKDEKFIKVKIVELV